jgi:hypothetical protein
MFDWSIGWRKDCEVMTEECVVFGFARRAFWRWGVLRRECRSEVVLSRTLSGSQPGSMGGTAGCWGCGGEV